MDTLLNKIGELDKNIKSLETTRSDLDKKSALAAENCKTQTEKCKEDKARLENRTAALAANKAKAAEEASKLAAEIKHALQVEWKEHSALPEINRNAETDKNRKKPNQETEQLSFLQFINHPVVEMIRSLDLMNLTPSGAIAILEQMKEAVKDLDGE